jgi:glycosyltransferase involved in cell wall biosynthesis
MLSKKIKKLPVIIPVYNNEKTILQVTEQTKKYFNNIIVVDDGSDKQVKNILNDESIIILRHAYNKGKGEALITGLNKAYKLGFKQAITIDADGQHNIEDILPYLDNIIGKTNVIFIGSRNMDTDNVPLVSRFGRKNSNFWIFLETFKKISDTQCGFRVYPTSIIIKKYSTTKYDFETEILVRHIWDKGEISEFPISVKYFDQENHVSHFDKKNDNLRISFLHVKLMLQRYLLLRGIIF